MAQGCQHSQLHAYDTVHRRSICHKTFHVTMNSSLKGRICLSLSSSSCALLQGDTNGRVPPVPSLSTSFLGPHQRFNLEVTHLLTLTPFTTSWWLLCHQHLMSCKATSQTHSPDQAFRRLQCTSHSFSFKPLCLLFQLFPFSCYWTFWESAMGTSSKLFPLQGCFHLLLSHFFKQFFAEPQAFHSLFTTWVPLQAP